ncbi:MAG: AAA family ATPase, partial [Terriglobales bacterium]
MLKLKKLQILGFKSFCDRTELKFQGEGIAAIIGPNGCGKSNIADAISWVLGEQSAKTLRGARMEDVIFAGTRDRTPTGMAEVSLTLIDPEIYGGADSSAPTEIEIQDDLSEENWDEAELRAHAATETERAVEDAQPGRTEEVESPAGGVIGAAVGEGAAAEGAVALIVAEGDVAEPASAEGIASERAVSDSINGTTVVAGMQIVQPQV